MIKLKSTQVAATRATLAAQQSNRCAICKQPFGDRAPFDPVLDHCHKTGAVRGVLHRGCNSLFGKVENNAPRYGVKYLLAFCAGLSAYLSTHAINITGLIHPLFKNEEEKRELRNLRARKARAKKKEA